MILGLLVAAASAGAPVEAWVRATPEAIRAAGVSFAEGREGDWVRVIGPMDAIEALGGVPAASAVGGYTPTPDVIEATLTDLASRGDAEVVDLGQSVGGRSILALRIGAGSRALRVLGGHHGDEGSSVVVALAVATALVDDPTLVPPDTEVWVVPAVNVDGVAVGTRHNLNEVDLNRNYGWEWSAETPYAGPSPFSEPESRAIRALARARSFVGGLSLHSGATNLGWVWNWTTEPRAVDEPLLAELAAGYAAACTVPDFWVTNGADWYETRGDTTDWTYGRWGALDYTLELTNEKSPPADLVATYVADHLDAVLALLAVPVGIAETASDAVTGEAIPATLTGTDLAPTWSGPGGVLARWYTGDAAGVTLMSPGYADGPLGQPLRPLPRIGTRPEPVLLSRGDGPTAVTIAGFGDGPITLSQPGEVDVTVAAVTTDTWEVDPGEIPSGLWTVQGDAGVLPRALFVGVAADRVGLEAVRVEGNTVILRGHGFGRGSEAWSIGGDARAFRPLTRLGATSTTLAFSWSPGAGDLLVWTNGAWLAAVDPDGEPVFDRNAPGDTGAPALGESTGRFDTPPTACGVVNGGSSPAFIVAILIASTRRKKI